MCGRITLTTPDVHEVARLLEASISAPDAALYRPRYNGAPTDQLWIVRPSPQGRVLQPAVWGFPGKGLIINARSETAEKRFAEPFAQRRVVVPADGFYEWTGPRDARRPIWFRPREGGLLYLAGLADRLPDGRLCFVILTTEAAGEVAQAHDRMPVVLARENVQAWLERPDSGLLIPSDTLRGTEVSARVNDVKNDDPSVLEPPEPPPPARQLTLL
jgi:putative SOS response-associated peptidase YedK